MEVNLMRKIDFWAGIPLCFFLSVTNSFLRLLGFRKISKNEKPNNILFIELSEMGSAILAYSAMKKAKEKFNAELFFLIFKENEESVRILDIIPKRNIITIRSSSFFVLVIDTFLAIRKIRAMKIDTVVDLELFSRFTSILSFLSGAKRVAGFYKYNMEGLYRGKLQTHRIEYNPHYHISQSFMTLVYELDSDLREVPLGKFEVKKEEVISAKISSKKVPKEKILKKLLLEDSLLKKDSKIILINPNASELLPIRKWPIENFISVIKKILALESTYVVLTGVQSDKCDAQKIIRTINDNRCIDFTGKTSFKELIDLYNISTLIISNDSGPAHFASLTDINIIVLFGPETPKLYSPLSKNCICLYANYACSPCVSAFNHRKTSCTSSKCLEEITPDAVFAISKDIIENK